MDESERKDAVIAALLPDVPFDGWTAAALRGAASRIGIGAGDLAVLFPRGPRDAVAWFSHWADRMMLETLAARPPDGAGLTEHLALAVRTRLALLLPHREAVRRGLSFLALPANAALGLKLLYDTVDATWYGAGDAATDFSFYTKRAMLAGIYAATVFYWLDDRSDGTIDTDAFLARRLNDAMVLPRLRAELGRAFGALPNPVRMLRMARPRY